MNYSIKHTISSFNNVGKFDNASRYVYSEIWEDNRYKFKKTFC